jgi:integrase
MKSIAVETIFDAVAAEMRATSYDEATIRIYERYFRQLAASVDGGIYTHDAGARFARMRSGPKTKRYCDNVKVFRKRIIRIADTFAEIGIVDLSMSRRGDVRMPSSPQFRQLFDEWGLDMRKRELAQSTCDYYGRLAREYLLFLEKKDIFSLEDADGLTVFEFLKALRRSWKKTSTYGIVTNFRPFLRFTGHQRLVDAINMVNARRTHDIVPVLDDKDEEAIAAVCCNRLVSARDGAITLLALTTGLRACDIVALKVRDASWRDMTISIIQKKTGNPLVVPMLPAVASAIADYLLDERPQADDEHLFLRSMAPYVPFADHASVYAVTQRVFKAAGLKDCHAGTRLLRHNAASKMLRFGSSLPTISAVLGHADPDTTGIYLETDAERMRMCVLPLPEEVSS